MAHFASLLNAFFLILALSTCSTKCVSLNYAAAESQDRQGDFQKIPTSCFDLASIGRRQNGLHLVKATNGIKLVFCDFFKTANTAGYETAIGNTDVTTGPVFFHGQRKTVLGIVNNVTVNYETEIANTGGGFDITTGVFTAPKKGKYYFSFSAVARLKTTVTVNLRKKDEIVASTACNADFFGCPLNLQTTLILNAGDPVSVTALAADASLHEDKRENHFTNFFGRLVEEDI